jgi:hypothetical protein
VPVDELVEEPPPPQEAKKRHAIEARINGCFMKFFSH